MSVTVQDVSRAGDYLTFALGNEEYGLRLLQVREIISYMPITAIPRTPAFVRGVINLRGQVIAVIDLRTKFGMAPAAATEQTCIIVVEMTTPNGRKMCTGIVVDRVSEVLAIPADQIEDTPDFGNALDERFILGMGKIADKVKILLDIDQVLSSSEIAALTGSTAAASATEAA